MSEPTVITPAQPLGALLVSPACNCGSAATVLQRRRPVASVQHLKGL
jgi:hypothetical protein